MNGWVTLASVIKPRGNRGEVIVINMTTGPQRFLDLKHVTLIGKTERPAEIEDAWDHQGQLILKFKGVDSISEAEELKGLAVSIPESQRPVPGPDEFFIDDLVGCQVIDDNNQTRYGSVVAFHEQMGASGLLEIEGEVLIPLVKSICVKIDPAAREIRVRLPEGLIP